MVDTIFSNSITNLAYKPGGSSNNSKYISRPFYAKCTLPTNRLMAD